MKGTGGKPPVIVVFIWNSVLHSIQNHLRTEKSRYINIENDRLYITLESLTENFKLINCSRLRSPSRLYAAYSDSLKCKQMPNES